MQEKFTTKEHHSHANDPSDGLSNRETFLRSFFDNTTDCILSVDTNRVVRDCNTAFLDTFGYTRDEVLNRPIEFIHPSYESLVIFGEIAYAEIKRSGAWRGQWVFLKKDASAIVVDLALTAVYGGENQVLGYVAVMRETPEGKQAVDAFPEWELPYLSTFDAIPDAVAVTNVKDGRYRFVNDGFCSRTGYSREEVIGKTAYELNIYSNPDDRFLLLEALQKTGRVVNLEIQFRRRDGSFSDSYFSAKFMDLDGEQCIISITKDVTEFKKLEKEKAKLEAQLNHMHKMEALGTLAGGIAHDFNNILTVITGYSEMALKNAENGRTSTEEIKPIVRAADRGKKLIEQILAFSRKASFAPKPLDIARIIAETSQIIQRTIPKMVSVETRSADVPLITKADAFQIEQVLLNLAGNAKDAMPDGGRFLIQCDRIALDDDHNHECISALPGEYIQLIVSDTGSGMSRETIEHVFDPFYTTKEIGSGTGLGLASVYGVIKGHGGHISCSSEIGAGTRFTILLPAAGSEDIPAEPAAGIAKTPDLGNETILVVDDELELLDLCTALLESCGYKVKTAASGEGAVKEYGPGVDLVIMDLNMPGIGGLKAMQQIHALDPKAKVMIASGYTPTGSVQETFRKGAAGYITKPFSMDELLSLVREVLDSQA